MAALVTDKMYEAIHKVFGSKNLATKDAVPETVVDQTTGKAVVPADEENKGDEGGSEKNPSLPQSDKRSFAKVPSPADAGGHPAIKPKFRSPFGVAASQEDDKEKVKKLLFSTDINDVMCAIDAGFGPDTEIDSKDLPENNLANVPAFTALDIGKVDALTFWTWKGLSTIAKCVLERCDYKAKQSYSGMTPVTAAIRKQDYSMLRILIKYIDGIKDLVNVPEGNTGMTPLALGCYSLGSVIDPTDCVKLLLRNGADVNKACGEGKITPLMFAILRKLAWCPRMVSILVEYGADINAKNVNGETAIELAKEYHLRDVADMLVAAKTKNFQTVKFSHLIDRPHYPVHEEK